MARFSDTSRGLMPDDGTKTGGTGVVQFRRPTGPVALPQPGDQFAGRYGIERLIGRGGMGEVYLATQAPLGRHVALTLAQLAAISV